MSDVDSDFTTTTEDVRATFVHHAWRAIGSGTHSSAAREPWFDRWLAQVQADAFDAGVAAEMEHFDPETRAHVACPVNPYRPAVTP